MRKDWGKVINSIQDATMGYVAVILSIVCFLVVLCVIMALVRIAIGASA